MSNRVTYLITLLFLLIVGMQNAYAQCPGSVYAGDDTTICFSENRVILNGAIRRPNGSMASGYWTNHNGGYFEDDSTTLSTVYIPSQAEVNAGYVDLILIPSQNCNPANSDTVHITIQSL